jgi:predicted DCC family thiol-disulfide oxidoreductase YuxK
MRSPDQKSTVSQAGGWVLYDGACGFCWNWVHFWERVLAARGFELKDLRSAVADRSLEIPGENLLDDIRVLTRSGQVISGADAYLYVTRKIWWAWPFYAIFHLPGFNWVLWRGYRWFNRNRYWVSRYCPIPQNAGADRDNTLT